MKLLYLNTNFVLPAAIIHVNKKKYQYTRHIKKQIWHIFTFLDHGHTRQNYHHWYDIKVTLVC